MKFFFTFFFFLFSLFASSLYYYSAHKKHFLYASSLRFFSNKEMLFYNEHGEKLYVPNRFIVKFISFKCEKEWQKKITFLKKLPTGEIIVQASTPYEALEQANRLYESGCALFAHPDFLITPKKRSFDPLFNPLQWNLHNYGQYSSMIDIDLNVYEAWRYATGKGVKVAVIDNGFDLAHPDLQNAFVSQIDLVEKDNNASYDNAYEIHGTACAGLIGARKNNKGIQGIAYNSDLIGIKLIGSYPNGEDRPLYVSTILESFWFANKMGADVINCSWGTYNVVDAVRYAIDDLAVNGRDGKGTPIVFATGNEGRGQWFWADDESALPSTIAVGAVTNFGEVAWYSNYGPALDFVAPSGGGTVAITTTDISGNLGYADGSFGHPNYCYATDITGFNGTSAAAPQVTGVIALMLERNPELTRNEVVNILRRTAKKIGDSYYNGHSDYYGYGLVDAKAAVREAIRLKVERDIINKSYPLQGFFVQVGQGKFDWIYITWDKKYTFKLEGMDERSGKLLWKGLYFDTIEIEKDKVRFGNATGYGAKIALKEFPISGYFIHFNNGSYDWIYIDRATHRSFKLEKLNYDGSFLWIPLKILPSIENSTAIF